MVAPSRQHDTRVNVSFGGIRVVGVVASDSLILQFEYKGRIQVRLFKATQKAIMISHDRLDQSCHAERCPVGQH